MREPKTGALDILAQEHRNVTIKLKQLETATTSMEKGEMARENWLVLEQFSEFIKKEIRNHFKNEDKVLFPILGEILGMESGPVAQMSEEHQILYEAFDHLQNGVEKKEKKEALEGAKIILNIFNEHIRKEDNLLYQVARESLAPWQLEEVNKKMQ